MKSAFGEGADIRQRRKPLAAGHRDPAHRFGLHLRDLDRGGVEHGVDPSAEQIAQRFGRALVGHVDDIDPRGQPQKLDAQRERAGGAAAGREGELARILLCIIDQVVDAVKAELLARGEDKGAAADFGHRLSSCARRTGSPWSRAARPRWRWR